MLQCDKEKNNLNLQEDENLSKINLDIVFTH